MRHLDSNELKQFLFNHLELLEDLQILVWFCAHSEASATTDQIARETGISAALVGEALERLAATGVLSAVDLAHEAFRYSPGDPAVHEMLKSTIELYQEDPRRVIELMTANAIERLRASALRAFAEAFRIRRN